MKMSYVSIVPVLVFFSLMNACTFMHLKNPEPTTSYNPNIVGYKLLNEQIFQKSCLECHSSAIHSGSIVLDSYSAIMSNLADVKNEVLGGTMPPDGPLSASDMALFSEWIRLGAPEVPQPTSTASPTSTPIADATPTPTPSELLPTYTSIRALIFVPKCLSCHSAGSSQSQRPLDNYDDMMANSSLIVAGDPGSSGVYTEVKGGTMPPRNMNQLTSEEISVIQTWIENGAPQ